MFENFGLEVSKIFFQAEEEMHSLKHPYVGSEHLLLSILKNENKILKKYLTYKEFRKELIAIVGQCQKKSNYTLYTPLLKRIVDNALNQALDENNGQVTENMLLISLIEESDGIALRLMLNLKIDIDQLYQELLKTRKVKKKLLIEELGTDLSSINDEELLIGREKELQLIMETLLRKNKNNPLLLGEAGVGKTAIVEELARRIKQKKVPPLLQNKVIYMLEMGTLVAGTKYRGEFEEKLKKIIEEITSDQNIILFIDEIHTLVNAGGAEGAIDASNILKPYLARDKIKCIGATTIDEYNKKIVKDKALVRRFQIVNINEPSLTETKQILRSIKPIYEKYHNVKISEQNIIDITEMCAKYLPNKFEPDRSIDVIDSLCAKKNVQNNSLELIINNENELKKDLLNMKKNKKSITKKEIEQIISLKSKIPLFHKTYRLSELKNKNNAKSINELEKAMNKGKHTFLFTGLEKNNQEIIFQIANAIELPVVVIDFNQINYGNYYGNLSSKIISFENNSIINSIKNNPCSIIVLKNISQVSQKDLLIINKMLEEKQLTMENGDKLLLNHSFIFIPINNNNKSRIGFTNDKIFVYKMNPLVKEKVDMIIDFSLNPQKINYNSPKINS